MYIPSLPSHAQPSPFFPEHEGWRSTRTTSVTKLPQGTGEASYEVIRRAFESAGTQFGPAMPEQALITVMRAVGGTARSAPYERLLDELDKPRSSRENPQVSTIP